MAAPNDSEKNKARQKREKKQRGSGCFWKTLMVIGIFCLITFCITLGVIMLSGRDAVVDWGSITPFLIVTVILGSALVYFSSRHMELSKEKETTQVPVQSHSPSPSPHPRLEFNTGDILCMAVVYEGHLPQGHVLNQQELAQEIIGIAHQSGLPGHINLAPDTTIQAKRADENAYYAGDYEPEDEVSGMLNNMVNSLRGRINASGQTSGLLNTKKMIFKSRSNLVSIVWVGLMVLQ